MGDSVTEFGDYVVQWIGDPHRVDPYNDNVDVVVDFLSGGKYVATFFTLENIRRLMEGYKSTREFAGGLYFWATDSIIVETLTVEAVDATVQSLLETGDFYLAFRHIAPAGEEIK